MALTCDAVSIRTANVRALLLSISLFVAQGLCSASAQQTVENADLVARGRYVAAAADCRLCHTSGSGEPYAGGFKVDTPFGPIYSSNITPDPKTGIGEWTFKDFKKAVHNGVRPDGQFLYPAMPLNSFTKIVEDDLKALWAYLRSVSPAQEPTRKNGLHFPFDIRESMLVWRWLFFDEGFFRPDENRGPLWNRGAYLVQALGHCGDCHTPRNFMGAQIKSRSLEGAQVGDWYAPNITSEALKDTNRWDKAQLIMFLKTGNTGNSTALGTMRDIVHAGLSHLTDHDLEAMATYLLSAGQNQLVVRQRQPSEPSMSPEKVSQRGTKLYSDNCASCHKSDGEGIANAVPPLAGNPVVIAKSPTDVIVVILKGVPPRSGMTGMPSFAGSLSNQNIADLTNYIRTNWGNRIAADATSERVAAWRASLALPK
jgi:mono/diheme cytochrome c family protein